MDSGVPADEDDDSRTESISSLLNQSSTCFSPNPNPILQALNSSFLPPSISANLNPIYDPIWSRNIPQDPSFTGFSASPNDDFYLNSKQGMYSNLSSPPVSSNANMDRGTDHHQVGDATKNPKKRTRVSRRAPTTVLTTDTTNFRQMVQEFTGIPTAPFAAVSSSTYSPRLDHLSGGGIGPLFPVKPSKEKIQLQQSSITSVDGSSGNYQLPPSDIQGLQKQPLSLLNSQNHLFSLQSLLQTKLPQQVNEAILGPTKSFDNQQLDYSGFTSSSTRWRGPNANLMNFDGVNSNTSKLDAYKVNTLDFDNQTDQDLENVVSSRNHGDQAKGNVDSWLCYSEN